MVKQYWNGTIKISNITMHSVWQWQIVCVGTLFAMVYVGVVVRFTDKYLGWFDRILAYKPGFRRYVYGLARYIKHQ